MEQVPGTGRYVGVCRKTFLGNKLGTRVRAGDDRRRCSAISAATGLEVDADLVDGEWYCWFVDEVPMTSCSAPDDCAFFHATCDQVTSMCRYAVLDEPCGTRDGELSCGAGLRCDYETEPKKCVNLVTGEQNALCEFSSGCAGGLLCSRDWYSDQGRCVPPFSGQVGDPAGADCADGLYYDGDTGKCTKSDIVDQCEASAVVDSEGTCRPEGVARPDAAIATPPGCQEVGQAWVDCYNKNSDVCTGFTCGPCLDINFALRRCLSVVAESGVGSCDYAAYQEPQWDKVAFAIADLKSPHALRTLEVAKQAPNRFANVARGACNDPYNEPVDGTENNGHGNTDTGDVKKIYTGSASSLLVMQSTVLVACASFL